LPCADSEVPLVVVDAGRAERLADRLLRASKAGETVAERRRARRLGRLLAEPEGRELVFRLTDEVLRTEDDRRAASRLRTLVDHGLPGSLGIIDRAGLRAAAAASDRLPGVVARVVRTRLRAETRQVVIRARDPALARHLARRRDAGFDGNINLLGEAILGDAEAGARVDAVCRFLQRPDVPCISVKISALAANLDVLAFEHSVEAAADSLRRILRVAASSTPAKLVSLDMEEYHDLHLTVAAFSTVLDEPEFRSLTAGIALQAYLPDSHAVLEQLCDWASRRRSAGGAPVRVRLVKGANLAMESVDAEIAGWTPAPYANKAEVDASFKRMLDVGLAAAERGDLKLGVGSHNLFDVAWALTQREDRGLASAVEPEMLEGMAPAQARAVRAAAGSLLLYSPIVDDADFPAAIAYLSRRLDENTAPGNFLRSLFTIAPGSDVWTSEREKFRSAAISRTSVSTLPRRTQARRTEDLRFDPEAPFANVPDTDFASAGNREWIATHLANAAIGVVPSQLKHTDEIDEMLSHATRAAREWSTTSMTNRRALLARAAEVMSARRGRAIAVMAAETGKTVREGDPEVSEGVDMALWAAAQTHLLDELQRDGVELRPRGVVLIAAPWNFPYSIPANGVCSALAAGNAVLLKPAPEAVATGRELVDALHAAGFPRDVVQLVRCGDDDVGRHLVTHDALDTVVLTGSYDTAQMFLAWKPQLRLIAETSGKNAIVITGGADLDLAIRDLVRSAFGHAGQKCSAASLAIVEASVHDGSRFLTRLADAVRSIRVGPATALPTMTGPVIARPAGKLARALTRLDAGERWLVEPRPLEDGGRLWSPGVRTGVRPGSWFHRTECFGPVLGIMRAGDLDEAISLQNGTDFGLVGGLESLDPDEIAHWSARVEVGNAYVNRHTTGAIVRRQPFGGWKHSSVGPGAKTGGPDDVLRFVRFAPTTSSRVAYDRSVLAGRDETGLRAEENVHRYETVERVAVRVGTATTDAELRALANAAWITGVDHDVYGVHASDAELARRIGGMHVDRLRALVPISDELASACHAAGVTVDDTAVTATSRVEMPRWAREQSISRTRHRHGRLDPGR
jgi:RHH-type transcriptional regulator, proline utilization regulon repressor / proline dehydrogenase / delta 1-pyrroline-5-carboxylate dehydrogenase